MTSTTPTARLDDFWANVEAALQRCAEATTVAEVVEILNEHFEPSSGVAFFGGSGGDNQLLDALHWDNDASPWRLVRYDATYYWCIEDPNGDQLTYIEGDIDLGNTMTG